VKKRRTGEKKQSEGKFRFSATMPPEGGIA
jgi:hypothetical protein